MERQQGLAIELVPSHAISASDLMGNPRPSNNHLLDVLDPMMDQATLKSNFKNTGLIKATSEDTDELRKLSIQSLLDDFYVLVPEFRDLYDRIDLAIKSRYRHAMKNRAAFADQAKNLSTAMNGQSTVFDDKSVVAMRRQITTFQGAKGSGKSAAFERCLSTYKQAIWHEPLRQLQVTYLKVELKGATTLLEYCARFLEALERALGIEKFTTEVGVPPNATVALMRFRSLLITYHVGVVVFDSLESTMHWPLSNRTRLFEHILGLSEIAPVFLITNSSSMYEINEVSQEVLTWDPLLASSNESHVSVERWSRFTKRLWKLHCLREQEVELDEELNQIWFEASGGIVGLAVRFFATCQIEAINIGEECISADLMNDVRAKYFSHYSSLFNDIARQRKKKKSDKPVSKRRAKLPKNPKREKMQRADFKRIAKKQWHTLPEDDLRYIVSQRQDENNYQALKEAGLVLPIGEFTLSDKFSGTL